MTHYLISTIHFSTNVLQRKWSNSPYHTSAVILWELEHGTHVLQHSDSSSRNSAVPKVDGSLWLEDAEECKDKLELLSNEEPGTMAPDMWEILLLQQQVVQLLIFCNNLVWMSCLETYHRHRQGSCHHWLKTLKLEPMQSVHLWASTTFWDEHGLGGDCRFELIMFPNLTWMPCDPQYLHRTKSQRVSTFAW